MRWPDGTRQALPEMDAAPRRASASARARVPKLRAGDLAMNSDYLKCRSVSSVTVARYAAAPLAFAEQARSRRLARQTPSWLDSCLATYLNYLFLLGRGIVDARYAMWVVVWKRGVVIRRGKFPTVTASLRGWRRAAGRARNPMPYVAMMLLARALMTTLRGTHKTRRTAAALVLPLHGGLCMRPSEALVPRRTDCFPRLL